VLVLLGGFSRAKGVIHKDDQWRSHGDVPAPSHPHHLQEQGEMSGGVISIMLFL
jgi:hypothetical protein